MKESNRQYGKAVEEKNRRDGKSSEREESSKRQSNEREDTSCQRSTIGVAIVSTINPFNALVKLLCACCATCFRAGPPSSDVISAEITNNRLRSCVFRNIPRQHSFADAGYRTNALGGYTVWRTKSKAASMVHGTIINDHNKQTDRHTSTLLVALAS